MKFLPLPNTIQLPVKEESPPRSLTFLPDLLTSPPPPLPGSKNVFAFWDKGIPNLYPHCLRNVLAWHRRLSPLGWNIYVLDRVPGSRLNIENFLDIEDNSVVPDAFRENTLCGEFKGQETSDLIRFPLLLRYGGIYMDVGISLFGDLDRLWTELIMNPNSPYEFAGLTVDLSQIALLNYLMISKAKNPLITRARHVLLELWKGKTGTLGMHKHPLVSHAPIYNVPSEFATGDDGKENFSFERLLDYAIQMQAISAAQHWVDESDGWNGPKYVQERCFLLNMMEYSHAHERLASWNGELLHRLFLLPIPIQGEEENKDQKLARQIVEELVGKSFCMKLGHEAVGKLSSFDSLGVCWRKNPGTDCGKGHLRRLAEVGRVEYWAEQIAGERQGSVFPTNYEGEASLENLMPPTFTILRD